MPHLLRRPRARAATGLAAAALLVGAAACTFVQSHQSLPLLPSSIGGSTGTSTSIGTGVGAKTAPSALQAGVPISSAPAAEAPGPAAPAALAPAAPAVPGDAAARSSASVGDVTAAATGAGSAQEQSTSPTLDRMVIRTAQLAVEVSPALPGARPAMEQVIDNVRQIAQRGGGFVSTSNTHVEKVDDQSRTVADLTLQVRAEATDDTLTALRALGSVASETSGSQDVTDEYVDLDANLRNLQASEAAIVKLMDRATRIEDVLSLQRELTNVRGQIERIQGRKQYLGHRTEMATIGVSLRPAPEQPGSATAANAWHPLSVAQRGWQASLAVLRAAAEVVIVAAAFSWWLVPFVGLGVYLWQRRRSRPTPTASVAAQ